MPWLILKPYVNYQTRTSQNFVGGKFDSTIVGLMFTLQWQRGVIPPRTPLSLSSALIEPARGLP